jgi:hypothetical protein
MGITPWLSKKKPDFNTAVSKATNSAQLLVITERLLKSKEHTLLNNIIFFLGLAESEWVHLQIDPSVSNSELMASLTQFESKEFMFFGTYHELFGEFKVTKSLLHVAPLSSLLNNASAKKQLFNNLILLKNQLTA